MPAERSTRDSAVDRPKLPATRAAVARAYPLSRRRARRQRATPELCSALIELVKRRTALLFELSSSRTAPSNGSVSPNAASMAPRSRSRSIACEQRARRTQKCSATSLAARHRAGAVGWIDWLFRRSVAPSFGNDGLDPSCTARSKDVCASRGTSEGTMGDIAPSVRTSMSL